MLSFFELPLGVLSLPDPLAESTLKGVLLRIWPLNPTANGRNFDADLAKTVPAAGTAKQGFSVVRRKTAAYRAIKRYN